MWKFTDIVGIINKWLHCCFHSWMDGESPNWDHTVTINGMTSLYLFYSRAKHAATGQQSLIMASKNSNKKEQW